jgi:hypothetical protein
MIERPSLLNRTSYRDMANDRITRSRAPKHWFDSDGDDDKSIHSSDGEATLRGKDEKDEEYV